MGIPAMWIELRCYMQKLNRVGIVATVLVRLLHNKLAYQLMSY
jgi:hypothetical protein